MIFGLMPCRDPEPHVLDRLWESRNGCFSGRKFFLLMGIFALSEYTFPEHDLMEQILIKSFY